VNRKQSSARDGLADAYAYLKGVLESDQEAMAAVRRHANPQALADALAFIVIGRSGDVAELAGYVDRHIEALRSLEARAKLSEEGDETD